QPKGVLVRHRGTCNLAQAQVRLFGVRRETRVLQAARLGFDASIWEVIMALSAGGTLCIPPREALLSGVELAGLLRGLRIEVATLTPSALAVLPGESLEALRTLITAGEACPESLVRQWAPGRRFFNAYGPTETTVCATAIECREDE